ncbi:Pyrroline-5-carboxylate reductase [Trichostrongylus colubriformis]|uniref:Pyrroline-5-carboxylate reductase n=1 Tax=Trichostrongylus colubriformis TaxID=6319 RepID=A0AAN8IAD8_TRICO
MSEFSRLCHAAGITEPMFLFVGGGNMASALIHGCVESGFASAKEIAISCQSEATLHRWKCQGFDNVFTSTASMVKRFPEGIVVLAVKPQSRQAVYDSLTSTHTTIEKCPLIVSILAGVDIPTLKKELSSVHYDGPVIRIMPNTAASVGSSASILCAEQGTTKEKIDIVKTFASKVGLCVEVDTNTFNAYGVLSGSAPAWAYVFMESLADGAVYAGCSRETALKLAAQSLLGAAQMILEKGGHPAALKDKVCSPGGTTISGIRELEKSGFRSAIIEAVKAATEKANSMA